MIALARSEQHTPSRTLALGEQPARAGLALVPTGARSWVLSTSRGDVRAPVAAFGAVACGRTGRNPTPGYPELRNDHGAREIRLGAREFECIGQSPPHDHPHIHMDMGSEDAILCPYCGTRYRRDDSLTPWQADPAGSVVEVVDEARPARGATSPILFTAHPEAREAAQPRSRDAHGSNGARASLHSRRRLEMFGHQGGEDEATVARKRGYLEDAQLKWPFLTNLDATTIKSEGQLVDLVKTRKGLSQDQAASDVSAWMEGKQF